MIDIRPADIAAERRTHDGRRFVLFTSTDLPLEWAIPWYGCMFDTGDDGLGILVGLDPKPGAGVWAAGDLLAIAVARAAAEQPRRATPLAMLAVGHLNLAASYEAERAGVAGGSRVGYQPGPEPSPYPWTVAMLGGSLLPLCSDPASREPGVTQEQLLIALDQLFTDACAGQRHDARLRACRKHVAEALSAELRRAHRIRDGFEG